MTDLNNSLNESLEDTQAVASQPSGWRTCPQCKSTFLCGIANGDDHCWCFNLPHVLSFDGAGTGSATGCLCPNCIQRHIQKLLES